jgi:hypothetical protein
MALELLDSFNDLIAYRRSDDMDRTCLGLMVRNSSLYSYSNLSHATRPQKRWGVELRDGGLTSAAGAGSGGGSSGGAGVARESSPGRGKMDQAGIEREGAR